jgi:hypothetical protein
MHLPQVGLEPSDTFTSDSDTDDGLGDSPESPKMNSPEAT